MITKKNINGVNFHLYKSNRFKYTNIEICFSRKLETEKLAGFALMLSMFDEASKKYKSYKEQAIAKEELYNVISYINISRTGYFYSLSSVLNFINMEYINENNYLRDVLEYFYEMTCNHDFHNQKVFDRLKKDLLLSLENKKESSRAVSFEKTIKLMDKDSISALDDIGTKEDIEKLSPDMLDDYYEDLINNSNIDVFIVGNTDVEKIVNEFNNVFNLKGLNKKIDFEFFNKERSTPIYKEETGSFNQTEMNVIYNTVGLTSREKEFVFPVFNYIFGNGGLSSKLYKHVREENSLCYGIGSTYKREENILIISSSLTYKNASKALSLVDDSLNEMINGEFLDDDISDAKKTIQTSINLCKNDPNAIMDYYKAENYFGRHPLEEKEENFLSVTKEEIINVAKKLRKNTTFVLCEAKDENN